MSEQLRPSTLGEILDRTVQIYRRNFWLFAGVSALPVGVMIAIGAAGGALGGVLAVAMRNASPADVVLGTSVIVVVLVALPFYFAAYVFSTAGLTKAAVSTHQGERMTIRGALASVRPHFWRYLWFLIVQALIVAVIPVAIATGLIGVPMILATAGGGGAAAAALTAFAMFLVIPAAFVAIIWLWLGYSMGMAVCVVEQKTAWESLKRAWTLSQGTRGRIFVLFLLVVVLAMVVATIAYIPVMIVVGATIASGSNPQTATAGLVVAELLNVVVNFSLQTVLTPVSWIALVLFYYDQRVRKEGFDIEWMMMQAGLVPQTAGGGPVPVVLTAEAASVTGSDAVAGPAVPPDTVEER